MFVALFSLTFSCLAVNALSDRPTQEMLHVYVFRKCPNIYIQSSYYLGCALFLFFLYIYCLRMRETWCGMID